MRARLERAAWKAGKQWNRVTALPSPLSPANQERDPPSPATEEQADIPIDAIFAASSRLRRATSTNDSGKVLFTLAHLACEDRPESSDTALAEGLSGAASAHTTGAGGGGGAPAGFGDDGAEGDEEDMVSRSTSGAGALDAVCSIHEGSSERGPYRGEGFLVEYFGLRCILTTATTLPHQAMAAGAVAVFSSSGLVARFLPGRLFLSSPAPLPTKVMDQTTGFVGVGAPGKVDMEHLDYALVAIDVAAGEGSGGGAGAGRGAARFAAIVPFRFGPACTRIDEEDTVRCLGRHPWARIDASTEDRRRSQAVEDMKKQIKEKKLPKFMRRRLLTAQHVAMTADPTKDRLERLGGNPTTRKHQQQREAVGDMIQRMGGAGEEEGARATQGPRAFIAACKVVERSTTACRFHEIDAGGCRGAPIVLGGGSDSGSSSLNPHRALLDGRTVVALSRASVPSAMDKGAKIVQRGVGAQDGGWSHGVLVVAILRDLPVLHVPRMLPTIAAATLLVRPGGRVIVGAGTYREVVRIDKPLELVTESASAAPAATTDGADEEGKGSGSGDPVIVHSVEVVQPRKQHGTFCEVRLEGLTVSPAHAPLPGGGLLASTMPEGGPPPPPGGLDTGESAYSYFDDEEEEDDDVEDIGDNDDDNEHEGGGGYRRKRRAKRVHSHGCVHLSAPHLLVSAIGCVIHGGPRDGVVASHGSRLRMDRCTVSQCGDSGVYTDGAASEIRLTDCTIQDHLRVGVAAEAEGHLVLVRCRIHRNGGVGGVAVRGAGSEVAMQACHVHDNKRGAHAHGIVAIDGGRAIVEHSEIYENAGVGVMVSGAGSEVWARSLTLRDNATADGVEVQDGGRVVVERGSVSGNGHSGISVHGQMAGAWIRDCNVRTACACACGGASFFRLPNLPLSPAALLLPRPSPPRPVLYSRFIVRLNSMVYTSRRVGEPSSSGVRLPTIGKAECSSPVRAAT